MDPDNNHRTAALMDRLEALLDRVERLLPAARTAPDWSANTAFQWRRDRGGGGLVPISPLDAPALDDLVGIETQKAEAARNTRQLLAGRPANHILLWGARGTGKSSLVGALVAAHAADGLRAVQVHADAVDDLPDLVACLRNRPERFVVLCDDLAVEDGPGYATLKGLLDGGLTALPDNVRIYATSNRRHIVPEPADTARPPAQGGSELHPEDAVEARISLAERFGLWLSFHPFDERLYLKAVRASLARLGAPATPWERVREAALQWALARGARSGRAAWQFAQDWAGRSGKP